MIVVATKEEYDLAKDVFSTDDILITGVGGLNVIESLRSIPVDTPILNFGYAGSNSLEIGKSYFVSLCSLYHPNVDYEEQEYELSYVVHDGVKCYTSNDFVLETNIKEPCLFDMELAYILALGFRKVASVKKVSDNLSLTQYEENIWRKT